MIRTFLALALSLMPAHSWYQSDCCGERDCAPVPCDQLVEQQDGSWIYLPTRNEFAPPQVRPSQDKNCHVCLGQSDKRSLCAYIQQNV